MNNGQPTKNDIPEVLVEQRKNEPFKYNVSTKEMRGGLTGKQYQRLRKKERKEQRKPATAKWEGSERYSKEKSLEPKFQQLPWFDGSDQFQESVVNTTFNFLYGEEKKEDVVLTFSETYKASELEALKRREALDKTWVGYCLTPPPDHDHHPDWFKFLPDPEKAISQWGELLKCLKKKDVD